MATNSNFKIKNGLSVGATDVIAANGMWIGASTGLIGPQGNQGYQGDAGTNGAQGSQGYQGNIGEQGIEGTSGIIVDSSAPANTSVVWLDTTAPNQTGPQGYQGDTGSQGSQGYQGVQGATGSQGATGTQGYQGDTGSQGSQGYQGVSGVAPWSTSGSLVYYNSGNVSVGANTVISAISNNAKVLGICDNANSEIATIRLSSGPSFSSGNRMEVFAGAGSCGIYGQDAADMWFATNSVERVRINGGSGFVGIKEANPASPLTVRRDSVGGRGGEISIVNYATSTLNNSAALNFGLEGSTYHDDNGNAQIKAIITNAGTSAADLTFSTWDGSAFGERTRISSAGGWSVGTTANPGAGAIYATGNITAYYSDGRLKDVTGKIENALSKVEKLSGIYYKNNSLANSFGYTDNETQVGVIAQDVEKVLPEIVRPAPFDLDENNNSKSGENYKTIQYERIVPLLIEAIKELKLELDSLKGVK